MSEYLVLKLVTGEQLIGELLETTAKGTELLNPIVVKHVHTVREGKIVEETLTSCFCTLTDQRAFYFSTKDIVFLAPLHPALHPFYRKVAASMVEDESVIELSDSDVIDNKLFDNLDTRTVN